MFSALRALWEEPAPAGASAPGRRDLVFVAAVLVAAAVEVALRPDLARPVTDLVVLWLLAPILLWRRTRPLTVTLVLMSVSLVVLAATGGRSPELYTHAVFLVLPYTLTRWGTGRAVLLGPAALAAGHAITSVTTAATLGDTVGGATVVIASAALGIAVRSRAALQARRLDQARASERERIARDLHDTVAHHLSAIAVRAQAGQAAGRTRPGVADESLRLIESEASRALEEMRQVVRILRTGASDALASGPGIADLDRYLATDVWGVRIDLDLTGDLRGLPTAVDDAVFRIVQEAVTNVRRHARNASRVSVRVSGDDAGVRVRVSDDGDPLPHPPGTGYGLVGIAERAALLGGASASGPGESGWTVEATLPRSVE